VECCVTEDQARDLEGLGGGSSDDAADPNPEPGTDDSEHEEGDENDDQTDDELEGEEKEEESSSEPSWKEYAAKSGEWTPATPEHGTGCAQGYKQGSCVAHEDCNLDGGQMIAPLDGLCTGNQVCCLPKNAGGLDDVLPSKLVDAPAGTFCFPIQKRDFYLTGSDYGDGRPAARSASAPQKFRKQWLKADSRQKARLEYQAKYKKRCHSGQDLFTRGRNAKVVSVAHGFVTAVQKRFLKCTNGCKVRGGCMKKNGSFDHCKPNQEKCTGEWAGAILIYHPELDRTFNYGEIDLRTVDPKLKGKGGRILIGTEVGKGQLIGEGSLCGMLHLEVYGGWVKDNLQWYPTAECERAGSSYQCPKPEHQEKNFCAKHYLEQKNPRNLDPRPYLDFLTPDVERNAAGSSTKPGMWCKNGAEETRKYR
jgi:hypothetical protein